LNISWHSWCSMYVSFAFFVLWYSFDCLDILKKFHALSC
jgi:hypothetical protein